MRKTFYSILLSTSIVALSLTADAQFLDNSFNGNGKVLASFENGSEQARSLLIQEDGKIVAAGFSGSSKFALLRLNIDGTLDNDFGTAGKVLTDVGVSTDYLNDILIQKDNKIVAIGYSGNSKGFDLSLVRYNSNGTLDNSFDTDGKVITVINSLEINTLVAGDIQSDDKIVAVGYVYTNSNSNICIVRYNSNGTLDNSFDTDGKLILDLGTDYDFATGVSILNDGKILVAGSTLNDFFLLKLNSNGTIDNTFDTDGKVFTNVGSGESCNAMKVLSDGKILLAGSASDGTSYNFKLLKYNADGTLDNSFDGDGIVTTDLGSQDYANSISLASNGKIVLGGMSGQTMSNNGAIARYNSDGSLDLTFDSDGKWVFPQSGDDLFAAVAVQNDDKILTAGHLPGTFGMTFSVMRLTDIDPTTDIPSEFNGAETKLYPNPATSQVNVSLNKDLNNASLKLVSLTGEILMNHENVSGRNFSLDISQVEMGLYFLEITEGETISRMKVVKN